MLQLGNREIKISNKLGIKFKLNFKRRNLKIKIRCLWLRFNQ